MNVNTLNGLSFQAKTQNENEYKKTGFFRTALPVLSSAAVIGGTYINKDIDATFARKSFMEEIKKSAKKPKNILVFAAVLLGAGVINFIIGAGFDSLINKHRSNKADKKAVQA